MRAVAWFLFAVSIVVGLAAAWQSGTVSGRIPDRGTTRNLVKSSAPELPPLHRRDRRWRAPVQSRSAHTRAYASRINARLVVCASKELQPGRKASRPGCSPSAP